MQRWYHSENLGSNGSGGGRQAGLQIVRRSEISVRSNCKECPEAEVRLLSGTISSETYLAEAISENPDQKADGNRDHSDGREYDDGEEHPIPASMGAGPLFFADQ
jgi:hypothetical protein